MRDLVEDCMTCDCLTVQLDDSLFQAAQRMKQRDTGFLPVLDGAKLSGVVTDRDLVIRGYAEHKDEHQPVRSVYTNEVISCTPQTSVRDAARMMADHQIRRLLVTDNGQLRGVVTMADLTLNEASDEAAGKALQEISQPRK
jgi:CBS domain-containing protein